MNYQKELDKTLEQLDKEAKVPTLLLHSCCAPCSSYVLEYLSQYFQITVFYYNPNIYPESEYTKRILEQQTLIGQMKSKHPISFMAGAYDKERFYAMAEGMETLKEGGARCMKCYELRLREAAEVAKKGNFDYFTTTLSISPMKNAVKLNWQKNIRLRIYCQILRKRMGINVPLNYRRNTDSTGRIIVDANFPNGKENNRKHRIM